MDVMGSTVDVKGSTVDVKGLTDGSHLRRFLLGLRDASGEEPNSPGRTYPAHGGDLLEASA
eukprot:1191110-Prorocentrum_minimum.AAC.2